jgi:NDP-sugar pyrophosphorylase family protein
MTPTCIVIADRDDSPLSPLSEHTCASLLPVAGRTLLELTLEDLYSAGIRSAWVVASRHAEQLRDTLEDGARYGMDLRLLVTRREESLPELLERLPVEASESVLVVRADQLRSPMLGEFLERAASVASAGRILATVAGEPAGVELFRQRIGVSLSLEMEGRSFNPIETLRAYFEANVAAAEGRFSVDLHLRSQSDGLLLGRRSQCPPEAYRAPVVAIAAGSRVHPTASLGPDVLVSPNCMIDREAHLESTVVLPGTYVGEGVELRNCLVWGGHVVRFDGPDPLHLGDRTLLAPLEANPLVDGIRSLTQRALGLFLLVLSLPLWIVATISNLRADPRRPFRSRHLVGNRQRRGLLADPHGSVFRTWEGASKRPILRHLPRLLAVVAGHLKLVGATPMDERDGVSNDPRLEGHYGLISPAFLGSFQSDRERRYADLLYVLHRDEQGALSWLVRSFGALFTTRSWLVPRTGGSRTARHHP